MLPGHALCKMDLKLDANHIFIFCIAYPTKGRREVEAYPKVLRTQGGGHPGQGVNQYREQSHTFTHYIQVRDANQPTTHVFGLGEETGVP